MGKRIVRARVFAEHRNGKIADVTIELLAVAEEYQSVIQSQGVPAAVN